MPLLRPLHHGKDAITDQRPIIARRVHWGNPLFMCTAFSLGVLSALCHHILYAHYDQRIVSSSDGAYQQKLVIRTGTALAFLVKSTLTVAVSIVFLQQFWTSLAGSSERVSAIDSITNVRANILQFLRIRIWMRQRVLALLALILWSLPLASVITPGTLHIGTAAVFEDSELAEVLTLDQAWFEDQNFQLGSISPSLSNYTWLQNLNHTFTRQDLSGPLLTTAKLLLNSDTGFLRHFDANTSYDIAFYGPTLSCLRESPENLRKFNTSLHLALDNGYLPGQAEGAIVSNLGYHAWVQSDQHDLQNPYWYNETNLQDVPRQYLSDPSNAYFYYVSDQNDDPEQSVLVRCSLYNASYTVRFAFDLNGVSLHPQPIALQLGEPVPYDNELLSDSHVDPSGNTRFFDFGNVVYNAILSAFNSISMGCLTEILTNAGEMTSDGTAAPEDLDLHWTNSAGDNPPMFQMTDGRYIGISDGENPPDPNLLVPMLESSFQALVIAIIGVTELSESYENVTVTTWQSGLIFAYSSRDLILAYGCAISATMLCIVWGMYLFYFRNRASFDLSFSTILRTTYGEDFDWIMRADYRAGECPLPKKLSEVKLRYQGPCLSNEDRNGDDDGSEGFVVVD